jgi:DNA-binding response OmpR family regulator
MKKRVLLIDDDEGILDALKIMLESAGYDVQSSLTPSPLFLLSQRSLPDVILLDMLLSGQDGREICKRLKSQKETKDVPILMISAHPNAGISIKKAGADDFLAKPFEVSDLLEKVKNLSS